MYKSDRHVFIGILRIGSLLIFLLAVTAFTSFAQQGIDMIQPDGPLSVKGIKRALQHWDYNDIKDSYSFKIRLINGKVINANSDIFKDKDSGRYYIVYLHADSVTKIYPDQTLSIVRAIFLEDQKKEYYEGEPFTDKWKFIIVRGDLTGISYYLRGNPMIDEIQNKDGTVVPVNPAEAEKIFSVVPKAYNCIRRKITLKQLRYITGRASEELAYGFLYSPPELQKAHPFLNALLFILLNLT